MADARATALAFLLFRLICDVGSARTERLLVRRISAWWKNFTAPIVMKKSGRRILVRAFSVYESSQRFRAIRKLSPHSCGQNTFDAFTNANVYVLTGP